jgi:DNA-binding CsgD family transcriptional regulator
MSNMLDTFFLDAPCSAGQALPIPLAPDQDCLAMVFDQMSHGVVVISPYRRIFHANKAAHDAFDCQGVLYAHHNELRTLSPIDGKTLQTALTKASAGLRSLVKLSGSGIGLTLSVVPLLRPARQHGATHPEGLCDRIALFFERAAICDTGMFIFFARSQGLTPTEEQVLTLLCRSMSTPEIATELKIAVSTVRSHVRSLCIKTGSKGSRELVNRVATLPPVGVTPRAEIH